MINVLETKNAEGLEVRLSNGRTMPLKDLVRDYEELQKEKGNYEGLLKKVRHKYEKLQEEVMFLTKLKSENKSYEELLKAVKWEYRDIMKALRDVEDFLRRFS